MTGRVTLVGGGPGDPGLLTIAGLDALRTADVVLYDHLAPLACLDECPPGALLIDVGKIPGGRATSQQRINELLVEHARAGRHVVRFKGGDPFVFGRGGEEVLACAEAGLGVAVIPGVTSAVAGPALAGIPVTHRGVAQAFTVVSGHVPPGHPASTTDWTALARTGHTIVVLMGVANLGPICAELVAQGLAPDTPAAVIADAWLPTMQTVRAKVTDIAERAKQAGIHAPAIAVIGAVAAQELPVTALAAGPAPSGTEEAITDQLRPARVEDAAELLVLQRACWVPDAIVNDTFEIPALHEDLATVRANIATYETWVLRRGPRLIGAARGVLRGTDWEVGRLMVAPDLQGQGLGRLLLQHIERQAPPSARRLWLFTGKRSAANIRLYTRAGYQLVPDDDDSLPHVPQTVRLVKSQAGDQQA